MAEAEDNETPQAADAEAPEAQAGDTQAQDTQAQDTQAQDTQAQDTQAAEPAAPQPAEPAEQLSPKERRRRARSRHDGRTGEPRTPEQRHAERLQERVRKAAARRTRRAQEREKRSAARAGLPAAESQTPMRPASAGSSKMRQGVVVSDRADKTITVRIDVARRHRRYEKIVRSSNTLHAHDENNEAHIGDVVRVIESRPLSRTKRWRLVDVLQRAR